MNRAIPARELIVTAFSEWTVLSAVRMGCPVRGKSEVYPLVRIPDYERIMKGARVSLVEFDDWHKQSVESMRSTCKRSFGKRLPAGWAAKMLNIFLKAKVYLAQYGRQGLSQCLHPPIDNQLLKSIRRSYPERVRASKALSSFQSITAVDSYNDYMGIIADLRPIAELRGCDLIELEELWPGNVI